MAAFFRATSVARTPAEDDLGYELLLRSPAPDQPVAAEALVSRILEAVATGVPTRPSAPTAAASATAATAPAPSAPTPSTQSTQSTDAAPAAAPLPNPLPQGPWTLKNGKGRVEVRLSRLEGAEGLRGADFDVPFGGTEDELRTVYAFLLGLAEQLQLSVFDPQLATLVGKGSEESVVGRWQESQSWMVDTMGVMEDSRSLAPLTEPPPLVTRSNKILLAALGLLALLWWLWSTFTTPDLPVDM
ncbi:MAG TPA: hypothetical protein VGK67_31275 [Myxococcales bacterium]|jgi:hypothetical protein